MEPNEILVKRDPSVGGRFGRKDIFVGGKEMASTNTSSPSSLLPFDPARSMTLKNQGKYDGNRDKQPRINEKKKNWKKRFCRPNCKEAHKGREDNVTQNPFFPFIFFPSRKHSPNILLYFTNKAKVYFFGPVVP